MTFRVQRRLLSWHGLLTLAICIPLAVLLLCRQLLCRPTKPRYQVRRDWRELPDTPGSLSFQEKFLLWDRFNAPPGFGPYAGRNSDRYLIYRCDSESMSGCGGWADRLKGILLGYNIANLTGRALKIEILKPMCDLSLYLAPNKVDWLLPSTFSPKPHEYRTVILTDSRDFKYTIHEQNFDTLFQQTKHVYFQANLDYLTGLRETLVYPKELSWMRYTSPSDIYAALYKHIFKLTPHLQGELQALLSAHLPSKNHRLVCAHLRMGINPSNHLDSVTINSVSNLPQVWDFLKEHAPAQSDVVFVMSDSQQVLNMALQQSFRDRVLLIPGSLHHVDRYNEHTRPEDMCSAFRRLILEFHLLVNCHVLLKSKSGLSNLASSLRGTDRDLFYFHRNGSITPTGRNDFAFVP
ncbi:uncharacterized protein LOC101849567 [Aplysia californica]|uniref:Uncharacterized protein LOC101849567 n=1 Tax=Aplysia californica TaxID=6500 RepID=A0ABM0K716_APLCA|nr:uncharacterized protein LOC101849567 [Aplysia californica]